MKIVIDLLLIVVAVFIALSVDRILRHLWRRIREEHSRIDAAYGALNQQEKDIDFIIFNKKIDRELKDFALNVSSSILDREMALRYASLLESDWDTSELDDTTENRELKEFQEKVAELARKDRVAFEHFMAISRRAALASILQWSDTHNRSIAKISLKLASETPLRAAHSIAALRKETQNTPTKHRHAYV
jgi:hypothetical protein